MKTDDDYRRDLTDMQYAVTRLKHTEPAFTGAYWDHWAKGHYVCVCCATPLYSSEDKFDAGCGWPSYSKSIDAAERCTTAATGCDALRLCAGPAVPTLVMSFRMAPRPPACATA